MEGGVSIAPSRRRAAGTIPAQPLQRRSSMQRRVGAGVLAAGLAALGAILIYRLTERARKTVPETTEAEPEFIGAARRLNGAAAILSFSVLTDSAIEHYRGAFHNPAMYTAPAVAAASLANSLQMTLTPAHFGVGSNGVVRPIPCHRPHRHRLSSLQCCETGWRV